MRDPDLLGTLAANDKVPALAIAVHVDEAFHCAKCIIRSRLWQPERWPPLEGSPTLAEAMKDAASIPAPVEVVEGIIRKTRRVVSINGCRGRADNEYWDGGCRAAFWSIERHLTNRSSARRSRRFAAAELRR